MPKMENFNIHGHIMSMFHSKKVRGSIRLHVLVLNDNGISAISQGPLSTNQLNIDNIKT